jgi:hypothetical protein
VPHPVHLPPPWVDADRISIRERTVRMNPVTLTKSLFMLVEPGIVFLAALFPGPETPGTKGSSRGTMSMRKSNWSDFPSALAMSARDRVRRLLESATMNARAVISAIKTFLIGR